MTKKKLRKGELEGLILVTLLGLAPVLMLVYLLVFGRYPL